MGLALLVMDCSLIGTGVGSQGSAATLRLDSFFCHSYGELCVSSTSLNSKTDADWPKPHPKWVSGQVRCNIEGCGAILVPGQPRV